MKICQQCGNQLEDNAKFCNNCGGHVDDTAPIQPQTNTNQNLDYNPQTIPNQTYEQQNYQQTNNQQQYTNQRVYRPVQQKITWLAPLINLIAGLLFYFLNGIGHFYLGLYKRGIVLCLLGLVPMILGATVIIFVSETGGTLISLIIGILVVAYSAYDAYLCTKAINQGTEIPLLFGSMDIQ